MRIQGSRRIVALVAVWALLGPAGCCGSKFIGLGKGCETKSAGGCETKPAANGPTAAASGKTAAAATPVAGVPSNSGGTPAGAAAAMPPNNAYYTQPLFQPIVGRIETPQDHIVLVNEKIAAIEDNRKVLATQLLHTQAKLIEREQALALATQEIDASKEAIVRARADLQTMKLEMEALRERLRNVEKADKDALESVIRMMERMIEPPK